MKNNLSGILITMPNLRQHKLSASSTIKFAFDRKKVKTPVPKPQKIEI